VRRLVGRILGRTPETTRALGRAGERRAARLLKRGGYRVLGRNVRVAAGEADLVCLDPDGQTVVIVEVKTRLRGTGRSLLGETVAPEASVHQHKRHKLLAVTRSLVRANGWEERPVRIDVVAVEWPAAGGSPTVRHHKNAVVPGR
jgi:putative endonuclease